MYQYLIAAQTVVTTVLDSLSFSQFAVLWIAVFWIISSIFGKRYPRVQNAPYHGYRWWFEPTFLLQARTFFDSRNIIKSGVLKVRSTSPFKGYLTHVLPVQRDTVRYSEVRHRYNDPAQQISG